LDFGLESQIGNPKSKISDGKQTTKDTKHTKGKEDKVVPEPIHLPGESVSPRPDTLTNFVRFVPFVVVPYRLSKI
jgi:hypothetical protein